MLLIRISAGPIGSLVLLGLAITGASAASGPALNVLKAAVPLSNVEKVHEGKGGMHQGCHRHMAPGAYPDCHWHYFNPKRKEWEIRRRKLDGTPCPANENCKWL